MNDKPQTFKDIIAKHTPSPEKTWKREMAIALLIVLGFVGYFALNNPQAMRLFELTVWPTFAFAAGAFGLDALAKQFGQR